MTSGAIAGSAQVCWHLSDPNSLLLHNVFLGKGWMATASFVAEQIGSGFVSQYQVLNRQPEKESIWERIRHEIAPQAPSRLGSTYLFESEADADRAIALWFSGQPKIKLQVHAISPAFVTLFRADSQWLNRPHVEWEDAARRYWCGEMSSEPVVEVLAHGRIYFPGWESPPFGVMVPVPPGKQAT